MIILIRFQPQEAFHIRFNHDAAHHDRKSRTRVYLMKNDCVIQKRPRKAARLQADEVPVLVLKRNDRFIFGSAVAGQRIIAVWIGGRTGRKQPHTESAIPIRSSGGKLHQDESHLETPYIQQIQRRLLLNPLRCSLRFWPALPLPPPHTRCPLTCTSPTSCRPGNVP